MTSIPPADPEVAAIVFARDLADAVRGTQGRRHGWSATKVDDLTSVVHLFAHGTVKVTGNEFGSAVAARGSAGAVSGGDEYHLRLRGDWYDLYPPQATFVAPVTDATSQQWVEAGPGSAWLPKLDGSVTSPWFALHPTYQFLNDNGVVESVRQLICCSMSFDYYISGHVPSEAQRWRQGNHKVIALLNRVAGVLDSSAYLGRSSC